MKNKFNLLKKYSRKSIILFIVLIILLGGIGYGLAQYQNISELTDKSQKFKEQKQYQNVIEKLGCAKSNLLVRGLKIKKEEINNKIQENKDLLHKTKKQQTEPDNLNKKGGCLCNPKKSLYYRFWEGCYSGLLIAFWII